MGEKERGAERCKIYLVNHEYIVCFRKSGKLSRFHLLPRSASADSWYKNRDNDPRGPWASVALTAKSGTAENSYGIEFPNGVRWTPNAGTYPRLNKASLLKAYEENRLWFGKSGKNIPRLKKYLSEVKQ